MLRVDGFVDIVVNKLCTYVDVYCAMKNDVYHWDISLILQRRDVR